LRHPGKWFYRAKRVPQKRLTDYRASRHLECYGSSRRFETIQRQQQEGPGLPVPLSPPGVRRDHAMELAKNLKIDGVSRLNPTPPLRIAQVQTVAEAVALMRQSRVGCLLVCEGDQIVGIFTERDLMRRVLAVGNPLTLPVAECMTPDPVVVQGKEPIGAAVRRMKEGGYRHLPVVDAAGKPVGVLSV